MEPALALMRKKTKKDVAKKLCLEGGWVEERLFDIGWSDESKF